MDMFLISAVPLSSILLTFLATWPSFKGCSVDGCVKKFRCGYFCWMVSATLFFSAITVYTLGSSEKINGRFMAKTAREKIAAQLSDSVLALDKGGESSLELIHIRDAMGAELSDLRRWRVDLRASTELKTLETKIERLFKLLNGLDPEKLRETLKLEREKILK